MNKIRSIIVLPLVLFATVGCDYVDRKAFDRERADSVYRDAMADYASGRIDKAVSGLERVIASTPANSSARFQLACLLQDSKKDYLGAICNYREFLTHDRTGEKASLAKTRIEQCERLLGPELMRRFDIGDSATLADANSELEDRVSSLEKTNRELEKRLEKAMSRVRESAEEVERMRKMLRGDVGEDVSKPESVSVESLLDDDDFVEDRIAVSRDINRLVFENEKESDDTPFAVTGKKKVSDGKSSSAKAVSDEPAHEPRPAEYVVQDGDTLYKIAIRFYGRKSAWSKIREANKSVISTDARIVVGQKIVLP